MLQPSGQFRERFTILRVAYGTAEANNEAPKTWPESDSDVIYPARVEQFAANEVIAQGSNHATGSKRIRIRGPRLEVTTADKVKDVVNGEIFHVTGVARDERDTFLDIARVKGQEVEQ